MKTMLSAAERRLRLESFGHVTERLENVLKDMPITRQDSDDDSIEIKKEILRKERKEQTRKPGLIIESNSSSPEVETPKIVKPVVTPTVSVTPTIDPTAPVAVTVTPTQQ